QRPDGNLAVLVVYFRIALFVAAVDPHAPLLLFAEAAADVDLRPAHRTLSVIGGQARHRLVLRALGHYVDDAADAAVGRYAVQQAGRALQDLDPFDIGREGPVIGRHAIYAIERDLADVAFRDGKAAYGVGIDHAAGLADRHGRVIGQRIRDGGGVLVAQEGLGVAGQAERQRHDVLVAEHAGAPAARGLAACVGLRQRVCQAGAADHRDGGQGGQARGRCLLAQRVLAVAFPDGLQAGARQQAVERL